MTIGEASIDEAIEKLDTLYQSPFPGGDTATRAIQLGIEALKLLLSADIDGGMHTFKGKSVEDCILIRKADLPNGLLRIILPGETKK